jgi:hypothetical protein
MRSEWTPTEGIASDGSARSPLRPTTILDPGAGFFVVLDSVSKVAVRILMPGSGHDRFGVSLPGIAGPLPSGRWKTGTEDLGKRMIQNIEFIGTRITNTSGDQPPLRILYEYWTSRDLGLIGLAIVSGPNDKHTAKIQSIDQQTPDASLFAVPPDQTLKELTP